MAILPQKSFTASNISCPRLQRRPAMGLQSAFAGGRACWGALSAPIFGSAAIT